MILLLIYEHHWSHSLLKLIIGPKVSKSDSVHWKPVNVRISLNVLFCNRKLCTNILNQFTTVMCFSIFCFLKTWNSCSLYKFPTDILSFSVPPFLFPSLPSFPLFICPFLPKFTNFRRWYILYLALEIQS